MAPACDAIYGPRRTSETHSHPRAPGRVSTSSASPTLSVPSDGGTMTFSQSSGAPVHGDT